MSPRLQTERLSISEPHRCGVLLDTAFEGLLTEKVGKDRERF